MPDPSEVPNEALETVVCGPGDRAEQARLFNRCFKKHLGAEELAWRYDRGPHGAAVSLVSRPPGGEGVCGYACSPRRVLVRGEDSERSVVGQTGDVMTDPAWRKRGLFSALDRAAMEEGHRAGWPLAIGFPNRRSAHIFVELGWKRIGTVRPRAHYLAGGPAARAHRLREGRLRAARLPFDVRACRRARRRLRAAGAGAGVLRPLERFPESVGALCAEVARAFPLMVRRDAPYLDWRFLASPSGLHRCLGLFDAAGELAGYVVVQRPRAGEVVGFLVDLLARDARGRAALIAAGLDELERAGATVVEATAIDGSWWEERLHEAGFLDPKPENHLIVIAYPLDAEHPVARAATDASAWYATDGDRDDETMG